MKAVRALAVLGLLSALSPVSAQSRSPTSPVDGPIFALPDWLTAAGGGAWPTPLPQTQPTEALSSGLLATLNLAAGGGTAAPFPSWTGTGSAAPAASVFTGRPVGGPVFGLPQPAAGLPTTLGRFSAAGARAAEGPKTLSGGVQFPAGSLLTERTPIDDSPVVPRFDSRPGAAYTLYLNFGGFAYTGTWLGRTPGTTPAYTIDASPAFSAAELRNIQEMWSRAAEKFAPFNINVTTADPAPAGSTDAQRKAFYDAQPRFMHMVVGGNGAWYDNTGGVVGVSGASVAAGVQSNGLHTNWTFPLNYSSGTYLKGIAETIAHENGHALRLEHQSRWNGNVLDEAYDPGTPVGQPPSASAPRAPVMGNSDFAVRGLRRVGLTDLGPADMQNDAARLQTNAGIGAYPDSGIGHTRATATPLPLTGTAVNPATAKGVITPVSTSSPTPLGEANYTTDFFQFTFGTGGGNVNVTLRSGVSTLTPGVADPGYTLDATLRLVDSTGAVLQTSGSVGNDTETIARSGLAEGTYFFQIASAGADSAYYDMGSYFLTGTLVPVPEPGLIMVVAAAGVVAVRRVRRVVVAS